MTAGPTILSRTKRAAPSPGPPATTTRSSVTYIPEKSVVQLVVTPHPTSVPTPDAVSVPFALSVYVTEVRVNTHVEQVPTAVGGQLKVPFHVAVEPEPVAVTLRPVPSSQEILAIKLLPDTVIGAVPPGKTEVPTPSHVMLKSPVQVLAKPGFRGAPGLPEAGVSVPPHPASMNATMGTTTNRVIRIPLRVESPRLSPSQWGAEEASEQACSPGRCQGFPVSQRVNSPHLSPQSPLVRATQRGSGLWDSSNVDRVAPAQPETGSGPAADAGEAALVKADGGGGG